MRPGKVETIDLGPDAYGLPVQGLILLDAEGQVRGYRNVCKHLPIPLDGGSGDYLDDERTHLFCGTHGARYRLNDGYCTEGPCQGDSLDPITVVVEDGDVFVLVDDQAG